MSYITIRDYGEDRFIEKKSEFIGYAKRVENEEEAKKEEETEPKKVNINYLEKDTKNENLITYKQI